MYFGGISRTQTVMLTSTTPSGYRPKSVGGCGAVINSSNNAYNTALEEENAGGEPIETQSTYEDLSMFPEGSKLVSVLIKMRSHALAGIPEVGMVITSTAVEGMKTKCCSIKQVKKNSAAHRCGAIRAGDLIRKIGAMDVSTKEPEEVVALIRKAAIDSKWMYGPLRLQLVRTQVCDGSDGSDAAATPPPPQKAGESQGQLMNLMSIAIRKNNKMVGSKKPNPIRHTLLQRSFCDRLDKALSDHGYYDAVYNL